MSKPERIRLKCHKCGKKKPGYWSPQGWRCMDCLHVMAGVRSREEGITLETLFGNSRRKGIKNHIKITL